MLDSIKCVYSSSLTGILDGLFAKTHYLVCVFPIHKYIYVHLYLVPGKRLLKHVGVSYSCLKREGKMWWAWLEICVLYYSNASK